MRFASREEFDSARCRHHVLVKVDFLYVKEVGGLIIPDLIGGQKDYACHKGVVVKEPLIKSTYLPQCGYMYRDDYHLQLGDTAYFGWEAWAAAKGDESLLWLCEDDIYLLIRYQDLLLGERGDLKFGLNGWVGGKRPEREKTSNLWIPQSEGEAEQEMYNIAIKKVAKELDMTPLEKEKMIVSHAPLSYPVYDGHLGAMPSTKVVIGETVHFPEGLSISVSNAIESDLVAVNVLQIMAHSSS